MTDLLLQYTAMAGIVVAFLCVCILAFAILFDAIKYTIKILKFIWRKIMSVLNLRETVRAGGETGLCITTADGKEIHHAVMKPEFQYEHNDALVLEEENNNRIIIIDQARYDDMIAAEDKLAALENAGVDNWSGYGEAMAELEDEE